MNNKMQFIGIAPDGHTDTFDVTPQQKLTSQPNKSVEVVFSRPLEYACRATENLSLGNVSHCTARDILVNFKTCAEHACPFFTEFQLNLLDGLTVDPDAPTVTFKRQLVFNNMFGGVFNATRIQNTPHCMADKNSDEITSREMFFACKNNLSTGKCQNALMRRTVGAALFPQFYAAKQNVKGR